MAEYPKTSGPLVSVCLITYNQEQYLGEAVDSVLAQQTAFDFELVIGEDRSTDQTRQIAIEFQKTYPHIVRVLPETDHLGLTRNFERTLGACRGKYVALLDGDDFWTNPVKLQRQVEVLEAQPDISVVFHPVQVVSESMTGPSRLFGAGSRPQRTSIRDVLNGHYTHTASLMVRNPNLARLPEWLHEIYVHDWPFVLLCARRGDIYCIPEPMATYRYTGNGLWSSLSYLERMKRDMEACLTVDRGLNHEYSEILVRRALGFCYSLSIRYQRAGLLAEAKAQMRTYWRISPIFRDWKAKLRLLLGIQCPRAWRLVQHLRGRPA